MELTAENVHKVMLDCLFKEGEDSSTHVEAQGVMEKKWWFHPGRLETNKQHIIDMLNELPNQFRADGGGGWSFLNACTDKNEHQWADTHFTMDELVILGVAIGKVKFLLPREDWEVFPGKMPYFVIN